MTQIFNIALNPELAELRLGRIRLLHSKHAVEQSQLRHIEIPTLIVIDKGMLVEIEADGRRLTKAVARFGRPDSIWDDCIVLRPIEGDLWLVVTCWRNRRDDKHETLNLKRIRG